MITITPLGAYHLRYPCAMFISSFDFGIEPCPALHPQGQPLPQVSHGSLSNFRNQILHTGPYNPLYARLGCGPRTISLTPSPRLKPASPTTPDPALKLTSSILRPAQRLKATRISVPALFMGTLAYRYLGSSRYTLL